MINLRPRRPLQAAVAVFLLAAMAAAALIWHSDQQFPLKLALGLLFSLMLACVAKLTVESKTRKEELEALVAQRTSEVRERELRYRELFDANPQPMWVYDLETLGFLAVNDAALTLYGYTRDEFLAMNLTGIRPPEDVPRLLQRIAEVRKEDIRAAGLWRHRRKDGTLFDAEITSHTLDFDGRRAQIVHVNDVTEHLRAERALRESEARFRSLTEMSSDFYWESDSEHRLTLLSSGSTVDAARVLPQGSPLGRRRWEVPYLTPDETAWDEHRALLDAHRPFRNFEFSRLGADGVARHIAIAGDPVFDASGAFLGYRGVGVHVTERKAAEAKIARLQALYAALSQCNQAIVRCASEGELLQQICCAAVVYGGMEMAWIGYVDSGTRLVRSVASYGERAEEYLRGIQLSADADSPLGRGPTGIAIRENRPVWCQDWQREAQDAPWREHRAQFGWAASASLPLRRGGVAVGALSLYAAEAGAFDEAVSDLLIEMAADVSFALDNFERDAQRQRAERALRESEARYRSLTELSSDWYWEQDENLRFTGMSRPNAGQREIGADTFLGRTRREAPGVLWNEPQLAALDAIVAARQPFRDFELSRSYSGGPWRFMQLSGEPILDAAGRFAGYRGVGKDITERKERDENLRRFRTAMDATTDGIYLVDRASMRFIDVNAGACAMLGLTREQILAAGPEGVLSMPRADLARIYDAVIAGGTTASVEMLRTRANGEQAWIEVRRHARQSEAGWTIVTVARDITQRKRVEQSLHESEERFRSLTEMSSDFFWESDAEHRLTVRNSANRKLSTIAAFQNGAQIGERRWDLPYLSPDEAGWQAHRAILDAHLPFRNFELSRLGADGAERHIWISGDPVFDASGAFKGYRGVGADFTERKRAESNLRLAASVFDHAQEAITITDADGNIIAVNRRFTEITGYGADEAIGRNPRILKSGRQDREFYRAMWASILADGYWTGELWNRRKDGTVIPEWLSISAVRDDGGKVVNFVAVFVDISQRVGAERALRESEHVYRTMFNSAPEGAWMISPDRLTTEVNQKMCDLLGYTREEMLGRNPVEFADADNGLIFQRNAHRIFSRQTRTFEVSLRHRDGHNIPTEFNATDLFDEQGCVMAVLAFVVDLTERKRHEAELRRLNEVLEQRVAERTHELEVTNAELEAFSYSVSHDLRAPLRAINGFSRMIETEYARTLDEQGKDYLRRVSAGADKMGHLIDDLLKLTRISRQAMRVETVDVSALARELAVELQADAPERRVEWLIAPQVTAAGDPGLLRVVLQNLLGNAWKYSSRRDFARIEFGVGEKHGRPAYFVRDNGAGFDMAHAQKLFGAFQRLHSATEFPGSGIGLATVARILHRHGGEAWAEGRVGEGATFHFSLG